MSEEDETSRNLFVRKNSEGSNENLLSDNWDDTVLVKAYDRAVNFTKEQLTKRMDNQQQYSKTTATSDSEKISPLAKQAQKKRQKQKQQWKVGDSCRAKYSVDEQIYEAVILDISPASDKCTVKYLGYGNTESVQLSSLKPTAGVENINSQIQNANSSQQQNVTSNGHVFRQHEEQMNFEELAATANFPLYDNSQMPPAPPVPPQLLARLPDNDSDALSSMLMSWYMNGFHTGFYRGLKIAKE